MSIVVDKLCKSYGEKKAIDNISFTAEKGSVLGFLGPNGAGKSTTMKILTCFLPQNSGSASVAGFDVRTESIEVRKNIGYLPEHNPLYLDMYVKEALSFIAGLHNISSPGNRIKEVIEMADLGEEQHKLIGSLSKGYRQRVGIAQAILPDPQVLILDEPTSGLDPNQVLGIRKLIQELGKAKTVVLSTHIMQEVEAVCNKVIIINKGVIVADDSLLSLKQNHNNDSLEQIFIRLTNSVSSPVKSVEDRV